MSENPVMVDRARTEVLRRVFAARKFAGTDDPTDVADALALGSALLGAGLVPAHRVIACERRTRRCLFVRRDGDGACEAFIALLFLGEGGFHALMRGTFAPEAPELSHLATPEEPAAAIYVWCLGGRGNVARRAVVRAVTEARRRAFPDLPLFARPMSREGRMMTAALDAPSAGTAWLGWVPARPHTPA